MRQAKMRAKIRDTEIYFDVEGASVVPDGPRMVEKPVMFAVHGGPGMDHTSHKPVLSPLSDKVQIVYIDHRGQGRSARAAKESYTLENNVEDLEALRLYLGLNKIILLGISYGGMVALTYASRYPQNVSHLIAVVTASDHRFLDRAKQILKERGTAEQIAVCERLWDGNFETEEQLRDFFEIMGPIYSRKFDQKLARERRQRAIVSIDAINQGFGSFLRTYDITDDLAKITAPTLVIAARHDWICAPEFSEIIASKIEKADLRIFENSGHAVSVDEPQNYIDAIRGFLTYKT
jgi:proline iminopeptidase